MRANMFHRFVFIAVAAAISINAASAAEPLRLDDPDRFSNEVVAILVKGNFHEAAGKIAETVGKPDAAPQIEAILKVLEGKKFDFNKKVIDKDFNGALHQIIHYAYLENL